MFKSIVSITAISSDTDTVVDITSYGIFVFVASLNTTIDWLLTKCYRSFRRRSFQNLTHR